MNPCRIKSWILQSVFSIPTDQMRYICLCNQLRKIGNGRNCVFIRYCFVFLWDIFRIKICLTWRDIHIKVLIKTLQLLLEYLEFFYIILHFLLMFFLGVICGPINTQFCIYISLIKNVLVISYCSIPEIKAVITDCCIGLCDNSSWLKARFIPFCKIFLEPSFQERASGKCRFFCAVRESFQRYITGPCTSF